MMCERCKNDSNYLAASRIRSAWGFAAWLCTSCEREFEKVMRSTETWKSYLMLKAEDAFVQLQAHSGLRPSLDKSKEMTFRWEQLFSDLFTLSLAWLNKESA